MSDTNNPLRPAQERALDRLMDRVEDRLWGAPEGCHRVHPGASWEAVKAAAIPAEPGYFWTRFDGMELSQGEVTIARLSEIDDLTQAYADRIAPGDKVIGQRGMDLYVLPQDPWAEGAMVLLVDMAKQRGPLASSVGHWVLALLGEFAILFDEEGEYRDGLYDLSTGEITPEYQRKILRRRLDLDPDGPMARFELGQLLREQGELRGAIAELKHAVKCAPEFHWSHYELGRCYFAQGQTRPAKGCFDEAAQLCKENSFLFALFSAWTIRCLDEDPQAASTLRDAVRSRAPSFPADQLEDAKEALEDEQIELAREYVDVGLAVSPKDLGLLALRRQLEQSSALN